MREHTQFRIHSLGYIANATVENERRWQKERESCCFLYSLSFRASGGNEFNEKWDLLFPLKLPCIFRWQMTKNTLCKKTKINHVSQNHSRFLFHCHARQHYHVGVSNGSKRKISVKVTFSISIIKKKIIAI